MSGWEFRYIAPRERPQGQNHRHPITPFGALLHIGGEMEFNMYTECRFCKKPLEIKLLDDKPVGVCHNCEKILKLEECEVYARPCGYLSPVKQWNVGKKSEFRERKYYDLGGNNDKGISRPRAEEETGGSEGT